jgi:hypothetical protein
LSRELDIEPSVVRQWKRCFDAGASTAAAANEDVVPASALREAHPRIRELERLLGKKQMEIEIPRGRGGRKKKSVVAQRVRTVTQHPVAAICRTRRMARQTAYYATRARQAGFYRRLDDETYFSRSAR